MTVKELLVTNSVFEKPEISQFNLMLSRDAHVTTQKNIEKSMIEFAKYHHNMFLQNVLEEISPTEENIGLINKILNAYPLENIN